jgi:hypothetical protein
MYRITARQILVIALGSALSLRSASSDSSDYRNGSILSRRR